MDPANFVDDTLNHEIIANAQTVFKRMDVMVCETYTFQDLDLTKELPDKSMFLRRFSNKLWEAYSMEDGAWLTVNPQLIPFLERRRELLTQ